MQDSTIDTEILDLMLRAGSRWVLWLLIALSLGALAVVIDRIWFFIQERRPEEQLKKAVAALQKDSPEAALKAL
ncbi:MAG TPA: hypothetical protein VIV58_19535, partial [Kofleriaceae bacterium]